MGSCGSLSAHAVKAGGPGFNPLWLPRDQLLDGGSPNLS